MTLPFTTEQFLGVFAAYNLAVWPMQIVLILSAVAALYFAAGRRPGAGRAIALILSLQWIWMGAVYHLMYFTSINKAAYLFGGLMIAQGVIFFYQGMMKNAFAFSWKPDAYGVAAAAIVLYALAIYPMLGFMFGHTYPSSPTFGLPCPTTIFTFGILLMSVRKVPLWTVAIPFLWSLLGFTAALRLGVREDVGLLVAGVLTVAMIVMKNRALEARTARQAA